MSNSKDRGRTAAASPQLPAHFYFHVPFCRSKCAYCDFYSLTCVSREHAEAVFSGMEAEVRRWAGMKMPGAVGTVYVGGGTPSLHAERVGRLITLVKRELPLSEVAEITVEANPDSLSADALAVLIDAGATRISLGVQSFDDSVLRVLGRAHDVAQARAACRQLAASGVEFSLDLMCGIPGQSMRSWRDTLGEAVGTGCAHVSVYPLSVEDGTPLAAGIAAGELQSPDPDLAADMMLEAERFLAENGLHRYEVANYAAPGHESAHNTAYWTGRPYAGIGPAAHGMLDVSTARAMGLVFSAASPLGAECSRVRYSAAADVEAWLAGEKPEVEVLSAAESVREDLMLGMRLTRGVAQRAIEAADLGDVFESLARDGLVKQVTGTGAETRYATTSRGWLLGNEVFGRIWNAE
ncbi:MAG: radical SAM family heme chaperone HemW [Coriobacteriia bacterium]|nr:radical SAM family heme chaperone HemW [Coriobacteriia bacterium]